MPVARQRNDFARCWSRIVLPFKLQVVSFAVAGELRHVVQTHVHHALDPGLLQAREEILGVLVGEADGADSHGVPADCSSFALTSQSDRICAAYPSGWR